MTQFIKEKVDESAEQITKKRNRLVKLASIFARTNSVLTGKKIVVNVVDNYSMNSPAWSSTQEVWLNSAVIKDDFSAKSLISLQGLDFHELSHLRFTPRTAHPLPTWVKENKLWEAFNILEDNRIENFMVTQLPSVANWLTVTISDYLLDDETSLETAFPLVYGRKYLPQEIQDLAVDKYKSPKDIQELSELLDEYITLVFELNNSDIERAKEIIKRFDELLDNLPKQSGDTTCNLPAPSNSRSDEGGIEVVYRVKNPHTYRKVQGYESSSNRPAGKKEQEQYADKVKDKVKNSPKPKKRIVIDVELPKEPSNETSNDDSNADVCKPTNSKNTSKENKYDRNENVKGDSEIDFDDLEFDDTEYADDDVDYGADFYEAGDKSVGNQGGTTGDNQQVTDVLNDIIDNTVKELSKEITSVAKQLGIAVDLIGGNADTPERARYSEVVAPAELVLIAKAFGKELERIKADYEPAYETEVDTGRLNVVRYLQDKEFDTCFDEWQEGKSDVTEIEAVILLDKSGSMSGENADNAYKSMWAIKKALEQVNATATVVLFDHYNYLLYSADEKAGVTIRDGGASGGTDPKDSLLYAKKLLAETSKPIKLLFMITDGAWGTEQGENAIKEMRNAGVLTCQAYLSGYEISAEHLEGYRHNFELLTQIKSAKDILTLGRNLVRLAISRNLAK